LVLLLHPTTAQARAMVTRHARSIIDGNLCVNSAHGQEC
jgi:hypothetical protein